MRQHFAELTSAVALTALALVARWLLDGWLGDRQPFATLYAAVALAVWLGNYRPAIFVALAGALTCDYAFNPPRLTLGFVGFQDMVAMATFLLSAAIIISFGQAMRLAQQRAENERRKTLSRQQQLEREAVERRRAESTLQIIADAVPALISYIDTEGRYQLNNRAYETWFGQPRAQVSGQHMRDVLGDAAWETIGPQVARALAGEVVHYETAAPYKTGGERWIDVTYTPHVDGGKVRGIVALVNDISARRQMEENLRGSEERFRALIENSWDGIAVLSPEGDFDYLSPSIERILGYRPEELLGRHVSYLLHPQDHAGAEEALADLRSRPGGSAAHRFRFRHRDGSWRVMDGMTVNLTANAAIRGMVVNFRDITEQREAERAMRASEARFHAFMDHSPSTAYIKDGEGRYLYVNRMAEQRFGRPLAECLGKTDLELFPAAVAAEYRKDDQQILESRQPRRVIETVDAGDGPRSFLSLKFPLEDATGKWLLAGLSFDVTDQKRVETQLRESEEKFRRIVETANEGIWLLDPEARVTFVNQRMAQMLGYQPAEMLGRHKWEFLVEQDQQRIRDMFARRRAGISEQIDVCFQHRDGRPVWTIMAAQPVIDEQGVFQGTLDMFTDVTERKQAEKSVRDSERLYRAIGESIDYGIWVCDAEGRNIYTSESFLQLVGLTQEQCSSFGWGTVLHPDDAERTIAAWKECVATMGNWDIEHRFLGVDGQYHPMLARGVPVKDDEGRVLYWAGINLDISRMKAAEEALREADRRKDEFLATLAHELRNPLAPIRNAVELLRLDADARPAAQAGRDIIDRQVQHLVRLIDDLLDISRITRNKLQLRKARIDLADAVHSAIETSRPIIEASRHALEVRLPVEPIFLEADLTRLAQVFANLLNNAAKYTDPGGNLVLTAERKNGQIVVSVQDSGIGISPEQLPHIFEMFSQVTPALDRTQGGLGIGLSLVRRLVEMHGGSVEAHSEGVGRGSEFIVKLPLVVDETAGDPPPAEDTGAASTNGSNAGFHILVVDDNQDAARTLSLLLKMAGHQVDTAFDGVEAVEKALELRPQVILLDIGLPKLNGYEAARQIRAQAGDTITLVALTGWGQDEDKRRAREAGFDHHLTKPVDMPALESLLSDLAEPTATVA